MHKGLEEKKEEIWREIWTCCGEQLELIDPNKWANYLPRVLMNMLVKERDLNEYYKKRLEKIDENNSCSTRF